MAFSRARLFLGLLSLACSGFLFHSPARGVVPAGSSTVQELQTRLMAMSLNVLAYLQTHRGELLDAVKNDDQAASRLWLRFKTEEGAIAPASLAPIEHVYEDQRQARSAVLNAENAQINARELFIREQGLLLQLLQKKYSASAQASRGLERLRWLLAAMDEVKRFTPETSGSEIAEKSTAFQQALIRYRREIPARQMGIIDEAQKAWDACVLNAAKMTEQETVKQESVARLTQARSALDAAFMNRRQTPATTGPQTLPDRLLSLINLPYDGWGAACFVAAIMLLWPFFRVRKSQAIPARSIKVMAESVEAAAAGDVSRLLLVVPEAGLERLAHSLMRLSGVMTRSENLVYHLAALVEASGDAIVSQNLEGKILSWNKGAQRIYGYAVEEVRGQSIGMLSPTDQGIQLRQILERVKAGEKVTPFEALHQAKNGRYVEALVRVSAIYDSLRQVIGVSFCAQELPATARNSAANPLTDTFQRS